MKKSSTSGLFAVCAAAFLAVATSASANVLLTRSDVFPSDPAATATQLGRLSRNAIPQDFSGIEPYPGANASVAGVTFNYITLTLTSAQLGANSYVQIELDSQGAGLFVSAYADAYTPPSAANSAGSFQTNWLGDQGSSGNYSFTTLPIASPDPGFFGVTVPAGRNLVLVLATAGAASGTVGGGTGTAYTLTVENFGSTTYGALVPEPSTWALLAAGSLLLSGWARRRTARQATA